jgi:hypothetical protein
MMRLRVDCQADHRGEETPRRLHLDGRSVEIDAILDQWLAPDHRYFKILGSDRAIYIVRHNVPASTWELTMYQSPAGVAGTPAGKGTVH